MYYTSAFVAVVAIVFGCYYLAKVGIELANVIGVEKIRNRDIFWLVLTAVGLLVSIIMDISVTNKNVFVEIRQLLKEIL